MKLYCELFLLRALFVVNSTGICNLNLDEFNFVVKEQPDAVYDLNENCVEIVGLTQNSLDRFTNLKKYFWFSHFTTDDINLLNQPHLFAHHTTLREIKFCAFNGLEELVVHKDLFSGLDNLEVVVLSALNLEIIPKKLFNNLFKLRMVNLSSNKLKCLDPDVFGTNPKLSHTFLGENQFLQSGIPLNLTLLHHRVSISFERSYVNSFKSLLPLLGHPNITYINLGFSNLTQITLSDFAQFPDRQIRFDIRAYDAEYAFYMNDIKKNGIDYVIISHKKLETVISNSRAYIETDVGADSPLCNDCQFIRDTFTAYVRGNDDYNIYLTNQKIVFAFFLMCHDMENHYNTNEFKTNCPDECTCQHNPFLDKVWIDCHGKNLTSTPTIAYPSQFEQISAITIDLSKNLLESFVLADMDGLVARLITELDLNDNQLKILNLQKSTTSNFHQINLCDNPIWNEKLGGLSVFVDKVLHNMTIENCAVGLQFPSNPLLYISKKSEDALELILENGICH